MGRAGQGKGAELPALMMETYNNAIFGTHSGCCGTIKPDLCVDGHKGGVNQGF